MILCSKLNEGQKEEEREIKCCEMGNIKEIIAVD
jgi:hypothetical protein